MLYPNRDLVPDRKKGPGWKKIVVFLIVGLLVGKVASMAVHRLILFPLTISSSDMEPSLPAGKTVMIFRLASPEKFVHGDVALFRHPESGSLFMLRRIVGLPGETIEIRGGIPYRNGSPLKEASGFTFASEALLPDSGPVKVGPEEFYVMTDRQSTGVDSKHFGPIPFASIVGKAWND